MQWVKQDPAFDWMTLDYKGFTRSFLQSQRLFNDVIGTDDPDLRGFREAGGKVLLWHGWYDQLIFPEGTIDYYERVLRDRLRPAVHGARCLPLCRRSGCDPVRCVRLPGGVGRTGRSARSDHRLRGQPGW